MTIRVVVGFVSQQIVESEFRKGNALVHGIQIFRIHGGNQCGDQVKSLGIGKGFALILEDFSGFVLEIIGFAAVRSNLLGILHPLDGLVLVGARNKCQGILFGVGPIHQHFDNGIDGSLSSIGLAVTKKVAGNIGSLSSQEGIPKLFVGGSRSGRSSAKGSLDLAIRVSHKNIGSSSVFFQDKAIRAIQKLDSNLIEGNIGQNLDQFLETILGLGPARQRPFCDGIKRIRCKSHASTIVNDKLETLKFRQGH
mmetsp:Transcript_15954/g.32969  ORF Transcript_15954/g.32969 Transcript_15954/m.32969 type:complete len:252 (-) Transcript_15954:436-1191(-)